MPFSHPSTNHHPPSLGRVWELLKKAPFPAPKQLPKPASPGGSSGLRGISFRPRRRLAPKELSFQH